MIRGRNEKGPCGSNEIKKSYGMDEEQAAKTPFILTNEVYERDFLPYYNLEFCKPETFLEFEIVLPFHIPMYISKTITIASDEGYLSFRFDMVTTNDSYRYSIEGEIPLLKVHKTKMLMMAAVDIEYSSFISNKEKYYNQYFDMLLEELNKIVTSYTTSKKDFDCHYITKEMLQSAVLVRSTDIKTWNNDTGLFMLHLNAPFEKEPLNDKDIQDLMRIHAILLSEVNPFATGERYVLFAKRYLSHGFYHEAVIYSQISVEVFIRTLFKELLREEGKTHSEIEEINSNTPFMTVIKRELSSRLGGSWDVNNETTYVSKWHKNTYELRNRATHSGRIPTFHEANEAVFYAVDFRRFVLSRVKANKKKYPIINKYFK